MTFTYKGVNWTATWYSDYICSVCAKNADQLKSTGANWASIFIPLVSTSATANVVTMATTTYTPTDAGIIQAISDLHARGIKVSLHYNILDPNGTPIGANVNPTDKAAWFASYGTAINHYATLAQANGVDMFSIGVEMDAIDTANLSYWTTLINGVRAIYKGPISYSANWYKYATTCFWSLIDVIGVDGYFPLTQSQTPTVAEIQAAWSSSTATNYVGRNWINELKTFQATQGKPLVFSEIGFRCQDYAGSTSPSGNINQQGQANCYEGTLLAFQNQSWFSGILWWDWFPNTSQVTFPNNGWTPQNELAQAVMTKYWGGGNTTQLMSSKSGISNTVFSDTQVATTLTCVTPATGSVGSAISITGKLTRNDTGAGVAGQTIQLQVNSADAAGKTATTAADGSYTISYAETVIRTDAFDVTFAGATV